MKKLLSIVVSIILLISICPTGLFSFSASAETSGDYTYTVSDGNATITGVDASISGNVTIPATLDGYLVTTIGSEAFFDEWFRLHTILHLGGYMKWKRKTTSGV